MVETGLTGRWRDRLVREFGVTAPAGASMEELRALYAAGAAGRRGRGPRPVPTVSQTPVEVASEGPQARTARAPRVAGRRAVPGALIEVVERARVALEGASAELHRAIREAAAGGCSLRVLEGPSGLGRTRLGEIVAEAGARDYA